jgi:hypothetical protein
MIPDDANSWGKVWVIVLIAGFLIGALLLAWGTLLGPAFNGMDYSGNVAL